jgi:hypothetical protein
MPLAAVPAHQRRDQVQRIITHLLDTDLTSAGAAGTPKEPRSSLMGSKGRRHTAAVLMGYT